jgi:flavin reductase (DIM6/NTAB) family NADH-FMN oxidoreductase RutF
MFAERTPEDRPELAVERQHFFASMAAFPTGVTVVTTLDETGEPVGLTCNAFMSVSAEPPLIAVSLDRASNTLPALLATRHFAVNFLAAGREELAGLCATKRTDKFVDVAWTPTGHRSLPVLHDDAIAHVVCELLDEVEAGDHILLLGRVYGAQAPQPDDVPLLYFRRTFDRWPV